MTATVEQIFAVGQPILDEIIAMPAAQRRFNALKDFMVARFDAMPESEIKTTLLEVLPKYVEELGLVTYGSLSERMTDDEFYAAMNSGTISWGDLCLEAPPSAFDDYQAQELEFGWDLEIPQLKLRKDIWENFPVVVEAMGTGADGAERHAIRIHRKNWAEWRETKAESFDDWQDWDMNTEFRLMKALNACRAWTVEKSTEPGTFAVIRMNFVPQLPAVAEAAAAPAAAAPALAAADGWATVRSAAAAPLPAVAAAGPVLARINDITYNFPTCWNNETTPRTSARRGDIISISIHNTKLRDAGLDRAKVERDLMAALRASSAWRVLPAAAGSREFCRLHMA